MYADLKLKQEYIHMFVSLKFSEKLKHIFLHLDDKPFC